MALIEIRNLVKRRGQSGSAFELRAPELAFERGRFYGIAGPSGSGKSTLLDMIALVLRPTSASRFSLASPDGRACEIDVLWQDGAEDALAELRKRMIGYILQDGGLIGFLTVRQNLRIPYQLMHRQPDEARIVALAERFGIERELDKKPRHLSVGQRQRSAILRALMLKPPLVVADEPTAALDRVRATQTAAEFSTLARETGSTIIMVSHDWQLLASMTDMIVVLSASVDSDGTAVSTASWHRSVKA
jgi:putative ABC transport system ATP-binding protein